jgi:sodium pump decarboxylase gamma subunit
MDLFRQAFTIMALGMTLVFVFLAMVILAVNAAARLIHGIEGEPREETPPMNDDLDAGRRRAAAIAVALRRLHTLQ